MKKYICALLIVICLLAGCAAKPIQPAMEIKSELDNSQGSSHVPSYTEISLKTDSSDLTEISRNIFESYLKSLTEENINDSARISDYEVNKIKVEKGDIKSFQVYVEYAIHPASSSYVLAGNGVQEADGWIRQKVAFVNVKKKDGFFKIQGIGTGP